LELLAFERGKYFLHGIVEMLRLNAMALEKT
jgi:hypothetical protein